MQPIYNEKAHGYWLLASANNTVVKKSLEAQTFTLNNDAFKKLQLKDLTEAIRSYNKRCCKHENVHIYMLIFNDWCIY